MGESLILISLDVCLETMCSICLVLVLVHVCQINHFTYAYVHTCRIGTDALLPKKKIMKLLGCRSLKLCSCVRNL